MNKINLNTGNLLTCILELLIGILLLINHVAFATGIIIAFGVFLTVMGIFEIVKYFRTDPQTACLEAGLARGLILALLGLFCMFNSGWFINVFPLLTILYGLLMLICGVCKLQWTVDMLRNKRSFWYVGAISAFLTLVFAVLVLTNPFFATEALWIFIGVTLIVEAVMDVVAFILGKR